MSNEKTENQEYVRVTCEKCMWWNELKAGNGLGICAIHGGGWNSRDYCNYAQRAKDES